MFQPSTENMETAVDGGITLGQRLHLKLATGEFRWLLPRLVPPIISITYSDFHSFLGKHPSRPP